MLGLLALAIAVPAALSTGPIAPRLSIATATASPAAVASTAPATATPRGSATVAAPSPSPAVVGGESTPRVDRGLPSTSTVDVPIRVAEFGPVRRPF